MMMMLVVVAGVESPKIKKGTYNQYATNISIKVACMYDMWLRVRAHWRRLGVQDVETLWIESHCHSLVRVGEDVDRLEWPLNLSSKHH